MQSIIPIKQSESPSGTVILPGDISLSFEFFPPKTPKMEADLWRTVTELAELKPDFVSVTYGAGGSAREHTTATVARIQSQSNLQVAAHLTCIGASREEVNQIARDYWQQGTRYIVALRGDLPHDNQQPKPHGGEPHGGESCNGQSPGCTPHPEGYRYALELVYGLRRELPECEISVAAYPETHPQALSPADDLMHLRHKIEAGANRAITQFFFSQRELFQIL